MSLTPLTVDVWQVAQLNPTPGYTVLADGNPDRENPPGFLIEAKGGPAFRGSVREQMG